MEHEPARALPRTLPLLMAVLAAVAPARAQAPAPLLSLADAQKLIASVQRKAAELNLRLSVAVVDTRGDLIAFERTPGATPNTVSAAHGKAVLSAVLGVPSVEVYQMGNTPVFGPALTEIIADGIRFLPGALPIIRSNVIVGAVGCSGATSATQDGEICAAGLAAGS